MKANWVLGIALAMGFCAHAEGCVVMVFVNSDIGIPTGMLGRAELKSSAMFHAIGVEVHWHTGGVHINASDDICGEPVLIRFDPTSGARPSPEALAYAMPFASADTGACIHVLLDRVLEERDDWVATALMAHVLTHEITHVLEHSNHHAKDGVMKAHWDAWERRNMAWRSLPFSPDDVELIHRGIAGRVLVAVTK